MPVLEDVTANLIQELHSARRESDRLFSILKQEARPEMHNEWRDIREGEAVLGKVHDGSFGWDNEYDEVRSSVPAFRIQHVSETNAEYLLFVKDGAAMPHIWRSRIGSLYYA